MRDSTWPADSRSIEAMQSGLYPSSPYPERQGRPDCSFYIRNGFCSFGSACQFNHPPDMMLTIPAARMIGEYPERFGRPACEYYLKTGLCKFGAACIFHHPKAKAGFAARVPLNYLGYPLRPNERGCAYYLRTGLCKFGIACKFHHPEPKPSNFSLTSSYVSTGYPSVQPYMTSQLSVQGVTSWTLPGASVIPSPPWQGSTSYAPLTSPQGLPSLSEWNAYMGQLGSVSLSESLQQIGQGTPVYKDSHQSDSAIPEYRPSLFPVYYPERPGKPECHFYMKKGYCKFGAVCKFHHPKQRSTPAPDCPLSPMGLPLRPGTLVCAFYSRYGVCRFGPNCKFDHPPTGPARSSAASPSINTSVVQPDIDKKGRKPSLSETGEASRGDDNIETEVQK